MHSLTHPYRRLNIMSQKKKPDVQATPEGQASIRTRKSRSALRAEEKKKAAAEARIRAEDTAREKKRIKAVELQQKSFNRNLPEETAVTLSSSADKSDRGMIIVFSCLLLIAMTIQTGDISLCMGIIAVLLSIGKKPFQRLRERFCVPVIAFVLFALLYGAASLYARTEGAAIAELIKFMASFPLAMIVLTRFDKKHIPDLLWGIAAVCTVIAFLCLDSGSLCVVYAAFALFTSLFGLDYFSPGNTIDRIQGMYGDANVTAAILGVSLIIGLHLLCTSKNPRQRAVASMMLGISAISFLTAMSRGAIVCFGLSLLFYLILVGREDRTRLFLTMLNCGIVGLVTAISALTHLSVGSVLPDLMGFVCGALIFLVDWQIVGRIAEPLAERLHAHRKLAVGSIIAVVAVALCGAILAFNLTGAYVFADNDTTLLRSHKLTADTYQVSSEVSDGADIGVTIYSQTIAQSLMAERTELYEGALNNASFVLPEDARVYFTFTGNAGDQLSSVSLSNGASLPLNYKLLPENIALRMQDGMLESANFIQRVIYWQDSLKLFAKSPLIGFGLGSTETWYFSVQSYFYQSKYAHNHVLQILTDLGLPGTICFLIFLLGSAWLLLRNLKTEDRAWVAMLLSAWLMINIHSFMEISFSIRAYQCLVYSLLMLPMIAFAKPLTKQAIKAGQYILLSGFWLFELLFGALYFSYRTTITEAASFSASNVYEYMDKLEQFISGDAFNDTDYKATYIANAATRDDPQFQKNMLTYVDNLRSSGTYAACFSLEQYYYLPKGEWEELFACSREGVLQTGSANYNWNQQFEFYRDNVLPEIEVSNVNVFMTGVLDMKEHLDNFNVGRIQSIVLSDSNLGFVNAVSEIQSKNLSDADTLKALKSAAQTSRNIS